jgi:HlyD family secretion protein
VDNVNPIAPTADSSSTVANVSPVTTVRGADALKEQPATVAPPASAKAATSIVPKVVTKPDTKTAKNSQRSRPLIIALVALTIVVCGVLAWWFTRAPAVPAVLVQYAPLVRTLQFSARVATTSRVEVGSTMTGRVVQVLVMEGADVKKGDELIRLEIDELRAALGQAEASENQANARLVGLRSTGRRVVDAAVAQADSLVVKAQAELGRMQALAAKGFMSQTRLDEARSTATVANAQRASAVAQSAANRGTEVAQARAQVAVSHAASAAASARLSQGVVIAPADAKVLTRLVEPGQIVQPGGALFSLALAGPLQLVAQVDERYLEQLRIGQPASVVADAFPSQRFAARVQLIAPVVDAQRGAIQVKLSVPGQPPAFLREDMTLSIEVETARRNRALVIPVEALHGDEAATMATVMIERNGHAEERTVRVGIRTLKSAEIVEGLVQGEMVLTGALLKQGSRVRGQVPTAVGATSSAAGSGNDVGKGETKGQSTKGSSGTGGMP